MREQLTWCVSRSTSEAEGARLEQVHKLVRVVSAFVDGKALAGTKVEVVSGGAVRDVVEALKKAGVPNVTDAKKRRRGAASGKGGLDVEVVVREGPKEAAKFVAGVDVVGVREVQCGDTELRGVDLGPEVSVEWADRNLDVRRFRDGEVIREAEGRDEWNDAVTRKTAAWCHYDGDKRNCAKWGKMYCVPVADAERLPPWGWRLPTEGEVREMLGAAGMMMDENWYVADAARAKAAWKGLESGKFRGALGGYRVGNGLDQYAGTRTSWMMMSENTGTVRRVRVYCDDDAGYDVGVPIGGVGLYVRCVRDKPKPVSECSRPLSPNGPLS